MSSAGAIDPGYLDGTHRKQSLKVARNTIRLVTLTVIIALSWASLAQVDEITRGDGRVIPLRRLQTIQSLEGGILATVMVQEGDLVQPGQIVAKMDPTQARSDFRQTQSQIEVLEAEIARLQAEVLEKDTVGFPEPLTEVQKTEQSLFAARKAKRDESLAALEAEGDSIQAQIDITEPLARDKSVSEIDLLKLRQQKAALMGKLTDIRNNYVQDAYKDMADRKAKLASLRESVVQKQDQFQRTDIRSPVAGRVNNINITTLGGVVQPGEAIMEITPVDDQLLIETKVLPKDVAFIAPGMPASVKITAYDFSVYGDLEGTVIQTSEDTVQEETAKGLQEYYKVIVKTDRNYLENEGETLPIRPGMIAQVDIKSGQRSVLSYIARPVLRAQLR